MPFQQWQLAFVLGLVLSHAVITVMYYWLRRDRASTADDVRLADSVTTASTDKFLARVPSVGPRTNSATGTVEAACPNCRVPLTSIRTATCRSVG